MSDKVLSFLGICRRARKMVIGAEITEESVREGRSYLVLYAEDASPNSLKRVRKAAEEQGVPMLCLHRDKEGLSCALGRLCVVLSVEDRGFADKLREMIECERGEFDDKIQG